MHLFKSNDHHNITIRNPTHQKNTKQALTQIAAVAKDGEKEQGNQCVHDGQLHQVSGSLSGFNKLCYRDFLVDNNGINKNVYSDIKSNELFSSMTFPNLQIMSTDRLDNFLSSYMLH